MTKFAVAGVGQDQPGIVARVTEIICNHQGNIEESSMTRLAGQFTWMLVVTFDNSETQETLHEDFSNLTKDLGITFLLTALDKNAINTTIDPTLSISLSIPQSISLSISLSIS